MALRIIFAGTPDFAIPSFQALINSSCEVVAVYTKPDRPSGRGLKLTYSPIKQYVLDHYPHLPILQPINLREPDTLKQLREFDADLMVVIAYGLILPGAVIALFKYGCINIHSSLLPKWRGAAPIQRALLAGDPSSGVTVIQIDEGLDTGDMLLTKEYLVSPKETAKSLHDELALLGAEALIETLELMEKHQLHPIPQNNTLATYAAKISKEEALINWQVSAVQIDRQIRAFNPWPIAATFLSGQLLKVWEAEVLSTEPSSYSPGQIIAAGKQGIDVATKEGILRLLTLQIPGGKPMAAGTFLNSRAKLIVPTETFFGKESC